MERVADFINTRCFREALARLCRLALKPNPLKDDLPYIKTWQELRLDITPLVDALEQIALIDEIAPEATNLTTEEIATDPLIWLQALDEYLWHTSPNAFLNYHKRSYFSINDGDETAWILPIKFASPIGKFGSQFDNLAFWLRHHIFIPSKNSESIPVTIEGVPNSYRDWLSEALAADTIKIGIAHYDDNVIPALRDIAPSHFVCEQLTDAATRSSSTIDLIKQAKQEGIHVLIMPELTITPDIRKEITDKMWQNFRQHGKDHELSVPIIVLGSFHEQHDGKWRNHSCGVLGVDGEAVFGADKRKSVTYQNKAELIQCAPTPFTCLFTPIGLMAITICKDLFDSGYPSTAHLLDKMPLDWLFVPSMSNETRLHKDKAKALYNTLGTIVAIANQEMPGDQTSCGFIHHDKKGKECSGRLDSTDVKRKPAD